MSDAGVLDLPRAVRLTLWGSAYLAGVADRTTALRAVQRDDEPHTVSGAAAATSLADLLTELKTARVTLLRVALPAPGDPSGLAGPASFTAEATDVGEAVVVEGGPAPLGLVPDLTEFGSVLEPGAMVEWRVHAVARPRPCPDSLPDVDRQLREAMRGATEVLTSLDVSRWREDAADRILGVRDGRLPADAVPATADPRAARLIVSAARVRAIASLAMEDDGASVTGWEAAERSRVLRDVDRVARRCLAAAVNAQVEASTVR